jgi:death-on-curing protein
MNHPFVDGNKRIGHAAMETFLLLNGLELEADVDDSETAILTLAAGKMDGTVFHKWVTDRVRLLE